jgi:tRNA (guanosine-2'-O-)-methyltransferase
VGLLLESVLQPFNVGLILRTAAAFGAQQVWLCGATPGPGHPSVRKTALGCDRYLSLHQAADGPAAAAASRAEGLRVIAVELARGAVPLHEAALAGNVCLAFGNEDRGCSPALLAAADLVTYIPQVGRVGSLNVAAAVAIALAEARRREWAAGS